MSLSRIGTAAAAVVLAAVSYAGARPVGPIPALGGVLDPANGIWSAAISAEFPVDASVALPGLSAETRVIYDDRDVPHIFAPTELDAYRAMGYVVARDRLFQMEMQARAGAGTLTELAGGSDAVIALDRQTRELGMGRAAERRAKNADTTSRHWAEIAAYTEGVNSYIDALTTAQLPVEYKLLGARPARWSPEKTFNLMLRMGWTLASSDDELTRLQVSAQVGKAAAEMLFPMHAPIVEPQQPNQSSTTRFDSLPLPPPGAPDTTAIALLEKFGKSGLHSLASLTSPRGTDAIGSNNWAVAPARSASKYALLAGDPHLELSLPSIWYEIHLVVPGKLDAYGVTIPGAPGVVIGFNRDVAWTFTNTGADVMDYYAETVDSAKSPTKYLLDGVWKPLEIRQELFRNAKGKVIRTDTARFTHRGPLANVQGRWISVRWTVLESTRDHEAFLSASTSRTAQEMLDSAAAVYDAPAQNMLAADRGGNIGLRSTGRYPIRADSGRGDIVRDGSRSASDWIGRWSVAEYPQSLNPARGFLSSANQEPLDPRDQPRYLGANWERPWRGMQINKLLRADSAVTPDVMRLFQSDPGSARADFFIPVLTAAALAGTNHPEAEKLRKVATMLGEWDRRYTKSNSRAVLFEAVMTQVTRMLWDELRKDSTSQTPIPNDMITASLVSQPDNAWWDNLRTTPVENRDALLANAIAAGYDAAIKQYGEPTGDNWRWDRIRKARINHLLRIGPFSRFDVPVQGGISTLWPSSGTGTHGPSWRMVVELGPTIRGWGTYPGGQSGNPFSKRYDNRVQQWSNGELDSLRVPNSAEQLPASQQHARLVLTPRR